MRDVHRLWDRWLPLRNPRDATGFSRMHLFTWLIEFFTIGVSVRLSDRSLHREEQKKFRQKLPPLGLETRTSRSSGQCLTNWARQESVGQEISEVSFVCFMYHFTCWTLFISRINRAWLYKGLNDSRRQANSDLAQLAEHEADDWEVVGSNPTGGNFWRNLFCAV